eukprot:1039616-Rhodomonas_salina.1
MDREAAAVKVQAAGRGFLVRARKRRYKHHRRPSHGSSGESDASNSWPRQAGHHGPTHRRNKLVDAASARDRLQLLMAGGADSEKR